MVPVPLAYRLRSAPLERVFYRLGLTDNEMQADQRGGHRPGPSVKAPFGHAIEQDRAGDDDQRIGENKIFRFQAAAHAKRIDADRRYEQRERRDSRLPLAAPP